MPQGVRASPKVGIAVSPAGEVYASDPQNDLVFKYSSKWRPTQTRSAKGRVVFFEADEVCEVSDKVRKYQKQVGITLPRI